MRDARNRSAFRRFGPFVTGLFMLAGIPGAAAQGGFDGHYVGTGISASQGAAFCPTKINITGFRVSAGQVRFGGFNGPIAPDRSVQLVSKGTWLTGRFEGTEFRGQVDQQNPRRNESCVYVIVLKLQPD